MIYRKCSVIAGIIIVKKKEREKCIPGVSIKEVDALMREVFVEWMNPSLLSL
jgi:hypothetical protein